MTNEVSALAMRWRVLVVEQGILQLRHLQALAAAERMHVISATTALDALQIARLCHIDGVIIGEAGRDPIDVAQLVRLIRRLPQGDRMPIVTVAREARVEYPPVEEATARFAWPLHQGDVQSLRLMMCAAWSRAAVLIVDGEHRVARWLAPLLVAAGLQPKIAGGDDDILTSLATATPDLLLFYPPARRGAVLELARLVRSSPRWRQLPIVVVGDGTFIAEALRAGVGGLPASAPAEEMVTQIRAHLDRARTANENVGRDPLTGLLLPRTFLHRLSGRLAIGGVQGRQALGLVSIGLETASATLRDRVYTALVTMLAEDPDSDLVWCRWAATDIAFACRADARRQALARTVAVARSVEKELLLEKLTSRSGIVLSCGVAVAPGDASTLEALLLSADRRLAEARGRCEG